MLLALLIMGCDRCDEDALTAALAATPGAAEGAAPAASAAALAEHCKLPEPLAAWLAAPEAPPAEASELWALACPGGPALGELSAQPRRQRLLAATEACGLPTDTAWQDGYPLLAHATAAWMTDRETETGLVETTRKALTGQPVLTFPSGAPPALPTLDDGTALSAAPPAAQLVTVTGDMVYIGGEAVTELSGGALPPSAPFMVGAFPDHRHPALVAHAADHDWTFAVDGDLPAETLSRMAISLAAPGASVALLGVTAEGLAARTLTVPETDAYAPLGGATAGELTALAVGEVPCAPAPDGMRCLPGGAHGDVELSTFYIDEAAVTRDEFRACVRTGSCVGRVDEALRWQDAQRYCTWAGKRLPTAWELAAAGSTAPTWSDTWAPAEGSGRDPLGPCDGAPTCRKNPTRVAVGAAMEGHRPTTRHQVRCASDRPYLTRFPAAPIAEAPPVTEPLTEAQRTIFRDIKEDPIWDKPVCEGDWGTVTLNCRDPLSYVKSNERRAFVWADTIRNRGGAYVGVGSDQNYSYAALARAELVWLIDYDPDVVALHHLNRAFTINADTVKGFIEHYRSRNAKTSLALIRESYADHPDLDHFVYVYNLYRKKLYEYYYSRSLPTGRDVETEWLRNPELYAHVRLLWQQDRIWPVKGDLTKHALSSIGDAARKLDVPVRIYYTSNAPDVWSGRLIENYKSGVLSLPMDRQSIILQTFIYPTGFGGPVHHHWHYNVQSGLEHQALMQRPGFTNVRELIYRRVKTSDEDMTLSGLRSE